MHYDSGLDLGDMAATVSPHFIPPHRNGNLAMQRSPAHARGLPPHQRLTAVTSASGFTHYVFSAPAMAGKRLWYVDAQSWYISYPGNG